MIDRTKQRASVKALREEVMQMFNAYKLKKGCAVCGYNQHYAALEFDHIIPREDTSKKWKAPENRKRARMLIEDPNIQVLCSNCHAIKTRENGDYKSRSNV